MVKTPQSFVVSVECEKAASQNGYRRSLGEEGGWASYDSTTAKGTIHLAAAGDSGPWFLALDHPGVIEALECPRSDMPGPGLARYAFESLTELYSVMPRVYGLGASLPDAPLKEFQAEVKELPKTTEAERLVVQRVGQDIFRRGLIMYWRCCCPLTGITDTDLLRASHIIPWKDCPDDAERLNVHNGLLLSALWDAAFDKGLVTFGDDGCPLFSPSLSRPARNELHWRAPISLTEQHLKRLARHREHYFKKDPA